MFFKILDRALGLRMMARAGREFAVAHGAQRTGCSLQQRIDRLAAMADDATKKTSEKLVALYASYREVLDADPRRVKRLRIMPASDAGARRAPRRRERPPVAEAEPASLPPPAQQSPEARPSPQRGPDAA